MLPPQLTLRGSATTRRAISIRSVLDTGRTLVALVVACVGCGSPAPAARTEDMALTQQAVEAATPTPMSSPQPTATSRPSHTPAPSSTPPRVPPTWTPSSTLEPTATPRPTNTPSPSATLTPDASPTPQRTKAAVVEVVDGDTIKVSIDGDIHSLRYIGIDTPELGEPMGQVCCAANEKLVAGQTIYLEKDRSETDQYGRLLRYVYLAGGTLVNAKLVRQGYAESVAYPPDTSRQRIMD